jgi:SAM-dependent methyltransferase
MMTDFESVKAQQQRAWATGDFAMIGWNTVYPGECMCEAVRLRAGEKVLDVATGSGNTALSAARRGCETAGIDYVPSLIDRARARAEAEGLPVRFEVGDCEQIPFADAAFDVVLSVFGSMFAPRPEQAARELIRVCRSGGRIGLANWIPEGFWGETFGLFSRYVPPPVGLRPPVEWGTQTRLLDLFGDSTRSMNIRSRSALFRYRNSSHWIEVFGTYFGPLIRALGLLEGERRKEFLDELDDILNRFNRSGDGTLVVGAEFVEVVMVKA